tara:strand:+ start:149 stop:376 length:228 start_codon:yes stop_codon:yes gene_type:complete
MAEGINIRTHGYQQGHLPEDFPQPWQLIECANEHLAKGFARHLQDSGTTAIVKCFKRDDSYYAAYILTSDEGGEG